MLIAGLCSCVQVKMVKQRLKELENESASQSNLGAHLRSFQRERDIYIYVYVYVYVYVYTVQRIDFTRIWAFYTIFSSKNAKNSVSTKTCLAISPPQFYRHFGGQAAFRFFVESTFHCKNRHFCETTPAVW